MTGQVFDTQELAEARAKLYQLLSSAYIRPPDQDFLRLLAGWVASQADGLSQLLSAQMRQGLALLDGFFKGIEQNSWDELGVAVSVEFTRLFRGVKLHYSPLPPYESVYREEAARVFGELTFTVHREYRRFGLDLVSELGGEPPDHISFELEFMRHLCSQEAEAWEKDNKDEALRFLRAEKEFVTEHLLTWLPQFCGKVREHASLDLFRGLADLTEGWITLDYQHHLHFASETFF